MKKSFIIITIIVLFSSFSGSAQIQRTFFGCILGESTKNEVLKKLNDKGIMEKDMNGDLVLSLENQKFGGYVWDAVIFFFEHDVLSVVGFISVDNYHKDQWISSLITRLDSKYNMYKGSDDNDTVYYKDEKTMIFVKGGDYSVSLGYFDEKLNNEKLFKEQDEL